MMRRYLFRIAVVITMGICCFWLLSLLSGIGSPPDDLSSPVAVGKGDVENLQRAYSQWVEKHGSASPSGPAVSLSYNKGLSESFTEAKGIAKIDLKEGTIQVGIKGITDTNISEVWLVDNISGTDRSALPEAGDAMIHAGTLNFTEGVAWLVDKLDPDALRDFEVNWVVISKSGSPPTQAGILYGSTSLFQRYYYYKDRNSVPQELKTARKIGSTASLVRSANAQGIMPDDYPDADLVNQGRDLFFNETFGGNGRTCGTCHPENNNFTIDPKFIAFLPDYDPLFIAERRSPNPLSQNFEKPELMRKVGLILENTNGFDDLENNFTMRSVPHLFAMRTSLSAPTNDLTTVPPDERTGWGGDGSPVDLTVSPELRGSLRDFAVEAVVQHFPKTLNREPGADFRLPTQQELDALEAFQLSLGRQEEFDDLETISMTNAIADQGRLNFMGEGLPPNSLNCNACHFNGGANTNPKFDFAPFNVTPPAFEMTNRSFAPRNEELLDQAGDVIDAANNPFDDGFGAGTNLFNVPTVIEAADTGPFFHGNSIDTVEAMIAFYSSQRHLRDGQVLPAIVPLNGAQVANVGAFLRVLNADENGRSAIELVKKAKEMNSRTKRVINLSLAQSEIEDAIEVLDHGRLHYEDALLLFVEAEESIYRAITRSNYRSSQRYVASSLEYLQQARDAMIVRSN